MKKIIFVLVILGFMSCSVNPSKLDSEYAKRFAESITYVKDARTGLCFGIVASRKTGNTDSTGIGVTQVPCSSVEHILVK